MVQAVRRPALIHALLLGFGRPAAVVVATAVDPGAVAPQGRKIYAAGSGLGMLSLPETVREILDLSGYAPTDRPPNVLYLGTATYDAPGPLQAQTERFVEAGCNVTSLCVAWRDPSPGDRPAVRALFDAADVVVVSGGNTLYAADRFRKLGIDVELRRAAGRGAVLAGGSAGGIVWFEGGHSDSMKPGSYKNPPGPVLRPDLTPEETAEDWTYVRVPGLGILPGLFCPHYDTIGENGVPRFEDFDGMVRRHPGEVAVAVDNWAAIAVDGDRYSVISRGGKPGSVGPGSNFTANNTLGRPGAWRLHVSSVPTPGTVVRELIPEAGTTDELFRPARYIEPFEGMLRVARVQNPDDGRPAAWVLVQATGNPVPPIILLLTSLGLISIIMTIFFRKKKRNMVNKAAPDELSNLNSLGHIYLNETERES